MSKLRDNYESADIITLTQVHNLFPLLVAIISIALAWGNLNAQLSVQQEQIKQLSATVDRVESRLESLEKPGAPTGIIPSLKDVKGVHIGPQLASPSATPTVVFKKGAR